MANDFNSKICSFIGHLIALIKEVKEVLVYKAYELGAVASEDGGSVNQTLNIIRLIIIVGPSPGILVGSININSPVFT